MSRPQPPRPYGNPTPVGPSSPPVARLTRRSLLAAVAAVGGATLTGCGTSDATSAASSTGRGASSGATSGGFPRTVRHELGTTTVAAAPSRVVAATDGAELASLLALGVRPVGYGQRNDPQRPWIVANGGADLPSYRLAGSETSFERLAAWRPDLIVAQLGFADESTYPRYTAIAPTVATSFIDWRASLRTVADAVGRTADADRLLRQTDDATAAARARLTRYAGKRVRIFTAFATGEIYVMNDASPVGKVAADLGIAPFPAAKRPGEAVDLLPLERLGELDADLLLVQHFGPERDGYESLARRELYRRLPVVKAGRSVQLTADESFASYFDSVLTVPLNVALLERHLPAMDA